MSTKKEQDSCTHTRSEYKHVRDYAWVDDEYIDVGGMEFVSVSTCVDVDLHRYQCTQCKKMFYYSSAARRYYEDGEDNHIKETAGQKVGNDK